MIDEHGILKLADFKLTKKLSKTFLDPVTVPLSKRGTVGYMSAELYEGLANTGSNNTQHGFHSYSSDLFALGCILYEMRRGFLPFGIIANTRTAVWDELEGKYDYPWESDEVRQHVHTLVSMDPVNQYDTSLPNVNHHAHKHTSKQGNASATTASTPTQLTGNSAVPSNGYSITPMSPELGDLVNWLLAPSVLYRCTWEQLSDHPFWYSANTNTHLDIKLLNIKNSDFPVHSLYEQWTR